MKSNLYLRLGLVSLAAMFTMGMSAQTALTPGDQAQTLFSGSNYTFNGDDGTFYVNPSFFTKNANGSYKFHAITGTYLLQADLTNKYLQVRACGSDGSLSTLQSDGSGALYIIGNGIGLPDVSSNQVGWTTEKAIGMAQTSSKVYEITGVVGKEFGTSIDFKFFGQAGWGIELKGSDGSEYHVTSASTVLGVGQGKSVNNHDDGNLFLQDGADVSMGDTVIVKVDLTEGVASAVLTTTVKKAAAKFEPTYNGTAFTQTTDGYVYQGVISQGAKCTFAGADAFADADWYMDPDFFASNGDGTYKFLAATGRYEIRADFTLKYFKVFPINDDNSVATYDKTTGKGGIWVIGDTGIGKPSFEKNGKNWWTGISVDLPLAPIGNNKYQLTLESGKQLKVADNYVNFKFFGQPDWGTEFNTAPAISLDTNAAKYFKLAGGNVNKADDVKTLPEGTYVFTLDVSKPAAAVLSFNLIAPTGINGITKAETTSDKAFYTLQGVRVSQPTQRGIYIHAGKKLVVK